MKPVKAMELITRKKTEKSPVRGAISHFLPSRI